MDKNFSPKSRLLSFRYAFNGLKVLLKEPNACIHISVSVIVVIAGIFFKVSMIEWICLVFAIGLVVSMEAINTSIEKLSDFVSPQKNEQIKKVKDVAAFAVLFCAFISVIIGLIIFVPKITALLS